MEDILLQISSWGCLVQGAQALATPNAVNKKWLAPGQPANSDVTRVCGLTATACGAMGLCVLKSDRDTKKRALAVHGTTWLVGAGISAYNAAQGRALKKVSYTNSAITGALGTTMLAYSLRKD